MSFKDSHFWFSNGIQDVDWMTVIKINLPFLSETQRQSVLGVAGRISINPLLIIANLILERQLNPTIATKGDREFSEGINNFSESLADLYEKFDIATVKPKGNSATSAIWKVLDEDNGRLGRFIAIYQTLLDQKEISSKASFAI